MTTGNFSVRELRGSDLERLIELYKCSFPRELGAMGFDEGTVRRQLRLYGVLKLMQRLTRRAFILFYVGEAGGEVVAAVSLTRERRAWYIGTVMVAPEHRRRGYGRKVLTHALEVARSQGAERAILHVLEDNYPAKGLYESEGFVRFERVVHFKHEPPEGEELALPSGYELRRIGPFDRRASRVIHVAREPSSAEVYGVPETPPWYLQALARIQPGVRERYAVVHEGEWVGIYSFNAQFREKGAASAGISLVREHRGVGLEEALLSLALRRAREVGCPRLLTKADERNTPLLSACKALGFTQLYVMEGMYRGL